MCAREKSLGVWKIGKKKWSVTAIARGNLKKRKATHKISASVNAVLLFLGSSYTTSGLAAFFGILTTVRALCLQKAKIKLLYV